MGLLCVVAAFVAAFVVLGVGSALAAGVPGPAWAVKSVATPTVFSAEDNANCEGGEKQCDAYEVTVTNVGTRASGGTVVIRDRLPSGVALKEESTRALGVRHEFVPGEESAQATPECPVVEVSLVVCELEGVAVPPEGEIVVQPRVLVTGSAPGVVVNRVEVEEVGGTAPKVTSGAPETVANVVNGASAVFGIQDFAAGVLGVEGASDVQAGDHPGTITTSLDWNTIYHNKTGLNEAYNFLAAADPETQIVDLPAGLVGDPLALEDCAASAVYGTRLHPEKCPVDSRVGVIEVPNEGKPELFDVYNMVPESVYPAEFAFEDLHTMIVLRPRVLPSAGGYVVSVSVPLVQRAQEVKPSAARASFWGDPEERDGRAGGEAFLVNPDACASGRLSSRLEMDAWVQPENWQSAEAPVFAASSSQGVTGCGALRFDPSVEVSPETSETDTPSGYEVDVRVPQSANLPGVLATPDLKDAVVSLPEGVSVSPGAANGLVGCEEHGAEGIELGAQDQLAGENRVQEGEEMGVDGLVHPAAGHCPPASQIGEVEVITPLLAEPLHGHAYVAEPTCGNEGEPACTEASATNGELYGMYLEVAGAGTVVKLKGKVAANPVTGRLTTTFTENPQFPFSEVKLRLNGGARAPLANPQGCGVFTATSDLTPWSTPATPDATPASPFNINGCPSTTPFTPSFTVGSQPVQAASLTSFSTSFGRGDGEQDLLGVSVTLPPGLVGYLSRVPLCGEPAAAEGLCPEASVIGTTTAAAGAGADPFWDSGKLYLTGPYNGAPFGLSIVVPAKAGPYNLGNVVVRAAINVNPDTTAVTVTSGALPQSRDGVPFRLKLVNALVNRPGFMLNPSDCEEQSVSGTIAGAQGARAAVSSPFAVEGCKSLPFKPVFTASTQGGRVKRVVRAWM